MFMLPIVGLHSFEYFLKTGFFFFLIILKQLRVYSQIISVKKRKILIHFQFIQMFFDVQVRFIHTCLGSS